MTETRKTSSTGGEKGQKDEAYALIPVGPLAEVARVYGFGASKYSDHNWRKGYPYSWSYSALQRHINAFWSGEDTDPESGRSHLAHAAFHLFTLMEFVAEGRGEDDRYPTSSGIKPARNEVLRHRVHAPDKGEARDWLITGGALENSGKIAYHGTHRQAADYAYTIFVEPGQWPKAYIRAMGTPDEKYVINQNGGCRKVDESEEWEILFDFYQTPMSRKVTGTRQEAEREAEAISRENLHHRVKGIQRYDS